MVHTANFVEGVAFPEFGAFFRFSEFGIHISENVVKNEICFLGLTTWIRFQILTIWGVSNFRKIFDMFTIESIFFFEKRERFCIHFFESAEWLSHTATM